MKVYFKDQILSIQAEDLPIYQKQGSIVRNSYFWALKSISCHAKKGCDWEFDEPVWVALSRILSSFAASGYLKFSETILEFDDDSQIPDILRSVSTRL